MSFETFDQHTDLEDFKSKTKVMLNGNWIGFSQKPLEMVSMLKFARCSGLIPYEVSVVRDIVQKEIKIYTDAGRCMRPLLTVEYGTNNLVLTPEMLRTDLSI